MFEQYQEPPKSMTRQELMEAYNTSYPTFRKWLKTIPEFDFKHTRLFTPKQVKAIFDHLGRP